MSISSRQLRSLVAKNAQMSGCLEEANIGGFEVDAQRIPEFQNVGILEFGSSRILESQNYGIFWNAGVPDFQNPGFQSSGNLEFWLQESAAVAAPPIGLQLSFSALRLHPECN